MAEQMDEPMPSGLLATHSEQSAVLRLLGSARTVSHVSHETHFGKDDACGRGAGRPAWARIVRIARSAIRNGGAHTVVVRRAV